MMTFIKGDFRANTPSLKRQWGPHLGSRTSGSPGPFRGMQKTILASLSSMPKGSFEHRGSPELEATLRRMVVVFRFLGWIWMALLVAITLISDSPPRLWVVYGSLALATGWALLTWYMARVHPRRLAGGLWFGFDSVVMLAIGAASVVSGAGELFHGGMPLSYVFVGALWGGLPGSLIAAVLLAIEQFAVHVIAELGAVRAAGSIIFFIIAAIVGWTFDRLRDYDIARRRAEGQLAAEREAVAAHEARVTLVNKLHDSVLQTFHAIRMGADDPAQSRYLARRQERELRRNIEEWRSQHKRSFRAALLSVRDDVEDIHRVEIEAVIRDDAELTLDLEAAIEAAREALTNAVKHSEALSISLFSEVTDGKAFIHIRDNGKGIDDPVQTRLTVRLNQRVEAVGGLVAIDSGEATGTEVKITVGA